jgi:hypothetical protein
MDRAERIRRLVDEAPPLSDAVIARLAQLLAPVPVRLGRRAESLVASR